ncbi:hypothetical protein GCM10010259_34450 [Streptomyces daghestanicus]|uniref:Uncharacterized protein n=1 Tax=Streptomyces daghestanicus TaxID=66885 RepID=A0ABQ3Q1P1_9ACTN|nr:hypothetical protein GCM10010259_34450 [Streptomyces daghestanicus]GHI31172.1 hypothetical protein Sdagh_29020 [Streptomyces daghestanicus]
MTAVRPTRRATCPKYSCDHHSGCPVRAPATVCGAGRVDPVGGDREHGVPRAGHAAYAVEEDEVAAVAGAGGLQVEADAVEAPAEELPGGGGDGGAGAGPVQPHAVRGLGGEDVAEPGVDADAGQVPVDGAGQPPGPRVPGGRRGAVVLQRSGVDVQVADAGGRRPPAEGGEVGVLLAAVDPGVAEPEGVPVPGAGAVRRVSGAVQAQGGLDGEDGDEEDRGGREGGTAQGAGPPAAGGAGRRRGPWFRRRCAGRVRAPGGCAMPCPSPSGRRPGGRCPPRGRRGWGPGCRDAPEQAEAAGKRGRVRRG